MIRQFRAWFGKKLEGFLWRFIQPQTQRLMATERVFWQEQLQQARQELERQMNFQPAVPPHWEKRVSQGDTYLQFEDVFRDSATIAKRHERYIPYFTGATHVLDIGCGRGEFLELLQKHEIPARGIDRSPEMIDVCRTKGLTDVAVAEANMYLADLVRGSHDGIFACHVLEHMPVVEVIKFFVLVKKALKPEGRLIVETPNPHSLPAFKLFWLDPTHVRPLFPEFMEWAARAGGFTQVAIRYLTEDGFSPTSGPWLGNYALVATR